MYEKVVYEVKGMRWNEPGHQVVSILDILEFPSRSKCLD